MGCGVNGMASDSEDGGNFSDGSCFGRATNMREDGGAAAGDNLDIDGISEHSSDEADSESEPDDKTKIKQPGEKPARRKKRKAAEKEEKAATSKKTKVEKDTTTKASAKSKEK